MRNSVVRNAFSRNGPEQMPKVVEPRSARSSNSVASGSAVPHAIATCARGIESVRITVFVAGSQSQ